MVVVYSGQDFPDKWSSSIFLAGPTPRPDSISSSWRPEALRILKSLGYDGVVFVPEPEDGVWLLNYDDQVEWELSGLRCCDAISFWIPRSTDMPAFTTNVEYGMWLQSGKVTLGAPVDAPRMEYLRSIGRVNDVECKTSLMSTIISCLDTLVPVMRRGVYTQVPSHVYRSSEFTRWKSCLGSAGNRLESAQVLYCSPSESRQIPFFWVLQVSVWVDAEKRMKHNEFITSRPDVSSVMLVYYDCDELFRSKIVLVKEFRSSSSNDSGYTVELPGGSCVGEDPRTSALIEVKEETGLICDPGRLQYISSKSLLGTLSIHQQHLFLYVLNDDEYRTLAEAEQSSLTFGNQGEITQIEIMDIEHAVVDNRVDRSTLGAMIEGFTRGMFY